MKKTQQKRKRASRKRKTAGRGPARKVATSGQELKTHDSENDAADGAADGDLESQAESKKSAPGWQQGKGRKGARGPGAAKSSFVSRARAVEKTYWRK